MKTPAKPVIPATEPSVTQTVVETNYSTIQVETNSSVMDVRPGPVESVVSEGPGGVQIETFVGVQSNINWAENAPAAEAEA